MAFLLQLQIYQLISKNPARISTQEQESQNSRNTLTKVLQNLRDKQSLIFQRQIDTANQKLLELQIGLTQHSSMFCSCRITPNKQSPQFRLTLYHQSKHWKIRSSELFKSVCRVVKAINKMIHHADVFIILRPQNGEMQVKTYANIIQGSHSQYQLAYKITVLMNSLPSLRAVSPILLYSCNLISQAQLKKILKISLKKAYYGLDAEFYRLFEVYQILPLINSQYNKNDVDYDCNSYKGVIQLYYNQLQNRFFKSNKLFVLEADIPQKPLIDIEKQIKQLSFPTSMGGYIDYPFIFNTIYVKQHKKDEQFLIFQGGRGKIIASPSKFIYDQSTKVSLDNKTQAVSQDQSYLKQSEQEVPDKYKRQFQRLLLVKMPRQNILPNSKKILMSIRYEKDILCHFRTSKCKYLPKYYHSAQQNYIYRNCLLMDYIPGLNLADQMRLKSDSITLASKLVILSHIANAIRFLEQYQVAHLDLMPANIIVEPSCLIKIIDFGQAYHHVTSLKYSLDSSIGSNSNGFVYAPGRTFPYAPPETSCRITKFTNQQDMFSLGVIICKFLFDSFPFICSEPVLKEIYRSKMYASRILFAPERGQDYGQMSLMLIMAHLMMKLLEPNEKKRPLPLWAYLIIKIILRFIR